MGQIKFHSNMWTLIKTTRVMIGKMSSSTIHPLTRVTMPRHKFTCIAACIPRQKRYFTIYDNYNAMTEI